MRELNKRPDVQAKRAAFLASDRAPFKLPEVHRKSVESQRARGFPNLNYDGASPSVPQKLLFERLRSQGAVMEFALPKSAKSGRMRIDIAIPALRLAIEIDGLSHVKREQEERDVRKAQLLEARGWSLLRFQNTEILNGFSSVLTQIQTVIALREAA